jgi:CRP-like cAMP-binding protein
LHGETITDDRLSPLREKGWLSTRPREIQDAILGLGLVRDYPSGVFLYRAGDPPNRMFGIAKGRLEMIFPVQGRPDVSVHGAGPSAWFAHPAVLAGDRMTTTARTVRPTTALVINKRDLFAFLERKPQFNREFYSMLNYTRQVGQSLLAETLAFTGVERVARRLAYLAETGDLDRDGSIGHSQEEIACLLGLSSATIQRAVRRLKSEALIETRYGAIRVLDATGLGAFEEYPAQSPETSPV